MSVGASIDLLKDNSVIIDYTSLDRESLSRDLRAFASTRFHDRWTNFNETEFAVVFLEIESYIGDLIMYQNNAVLGETQPSTALRRQNFINIAKSYDYFMSGPVGSSVRVTVTADISQLPFDLLADSFQAQGANDWVFQPSVNTTISITPQSFEMLAGALFKDQLLGTSDGSKNQTYVLDVTGRNSPLLYQNFPQIGNVPILEISVGGAIYELKRLEADAQSTDEVFFLRTSEADVVTIFFGDGVNGKRPPSGDDIKYTCKVGAPGNSNVNPRTIETILTPISGLLTITNEQKAAGGSPRETLQEGKAALPASISTNNRAVTQEDFAALLISDGAPANVVKASATKGADREINVWLVPSGGGPLTNVIRNDVSAFLTDRKILGQKTLLRDRTDIPMRLVMDVFVAPNWRPDDVISRVRELFLTEDPEVLAAGGGSAVYDFANMGLGARDDARQPQITYTRINKLISRLEESGVQKMEIRELRTIPTSKTDPFRDNNGNGTIQNVKYLLPRDIARREFVVRFTSATDFEVFRRIVGFSTFLADTQLVDDSLDMSNLPDINIVPALNMTLNPNRYQTVTFPVDTDPLVTKGNLVQTAPSAGSVFGNAEVGDEYYLEVLDGVGTLPGPTLQIVTYTTGIGDISFTVEAGTDAFVNGDTLSFDIFPLNGKDIILRPDELPTFVRDTSGEALDFETHAKTAI